MALLQVLRYPDPRLRHRAGSVERVDDEVRRLIDDLFETMYDAPGVGLAAVQVGVDRRVVVVDASEDKGAPLTLVNPEILGCEGEEETQEGCLSVPGVYEMVRRAERIRFRALDRDGAPFEADAEGLLAVCIQHECDHLEGRLFVDYLSELKRRRIRKRLEKQRRQGIEAPAPKRREGTVI